MTPAALKSASRGAPVGPRTLCRVPHRRLASLLSLAWVALAALAALVVLPGTPTAAAQRSATAGTGPVALIGSGGLTWQDVGPDTAGLGTYLDLGSTGQLAVRSVRSSACPVDGWLAVSAGRRAADSEVEAPTGQPSSCRAPSATFGADGGPAVVQNWQSYLDEAQKGSFDAEPGTLGRALRAAGLTSAAVGPGAVIALAGPDGVAAHAWSGLGNGYDTLTLYPGSGDSERFAADVAAALATHPDVLVVDIGGIRDVRDDLLAANGKNGTVTSRSDQAAILDDRVSEVTTALAGGTTVFVASLFDSGTDPRLRLLAAAGDDYVSSLLSSRSTRQDGLAQTTDLLPTIMHVVGAPVPATAVGSRVFAVEPGGSTLSRYQKLLDLDQAAQRVHVVVPVFFLSLILAQILLYLLVTLVLRSGPGAQRRTRVLTLLELLAVLFACVPAASFLANLLPWWRNASPGWAVTTAVAAISVPMAAFALVGPWRRRVLGPMGIVGAITACVLAADVMTGSHLMLSSLMGVQPVVAGRFYGFSNPGFALFATGALLAATSLADLLVSRGRTRAAVSCVATIGVLATLVDGAPGLGADFGGPPAIIPAFAVLALLVAGVKVTWRKALLIGAVSVAVVVGIALLDWLRPVEDQTHLGRFIQTVLDGGLWSVVSRKAQQNLDILFGSPLSALLPIAAVFVVLVLARPAKWGVRPLQAAYERAPVLRSGMIAFGVLIAIGFALNDSGTVVPAVAATVALPLLIAASASALQREDADRQVSGSSVRARRAS